MKLRCWPGCVAELVVSTCGNEGKRVCVLQRSDDYRGWPDGTGALWLTQPLQPLPATFSTPSGQVLRMLPESLQELVIPDAWLRPILPPPEAETVPTARPQPIEA